MASHAIGENELYLAFNQNLHFAYLDIIEKYLSYNVCIFFLFLYYKEQKIYHICYRVHPLYKIKDSCIENLIYDIWKQYPLCALYMKWTSRNI